MLNLYPYAAGHLMVCPYRHIADYTEVTDEESAEIGSLTRAAMRTLRAVSHAEGFNVGMNQGAAGGAGIRAHLHQHVVPRWVGDSNFMPVIGHTKTLPQLLQDTRAAARPGVVAGRGGSLGPVAARPASRTPARRDELLAERLDLVGQVAGVDPAGLLVERPRA